jgi:murein L,D-transpeptidase YcbB/YkuD
MRLYLSILFSVLLLVFLPACKKHRKHAAGNQTASVYPLAEIKPQGFDIDSAQIGKFLNGTFERKEFQASLLKFYQDRGFTPVWTDQGKVIPLASKLLGKLLHADEEGLNPAVYRTAEIKRLIDQKDKNNEVLQNIDILLSTELCRYTADVGHGFTRRQKDELGWFVKQKPVKYDSVLNVTIADKGTGDVFLKLEPPHPEYASLKTMLASYRELADKGGWPTLQAVKLKLGDVSDDVIKLRERLSVTGDFRTSPSSFYNPRIFDRGVELSVRSFQTRNGLDPTGVVDAKTLEALNMPIAERISQVRVNMERWRLVPPFGQRYLVVNVPEFKLHVFDNGQEAFQMRVVVGKEYKSTPVFNDNLQYIVFSPYWNIPKSITEEEVLPAWHRNPDFLVKNHMEVVKGYSTPPVIVNPWQVPWSHIDDDDFDYRIRQRPGDKNPLGLIKFIFPNNHNVYLHDTPADFLFNKVQRAYSHGCIRLEYPVKLAQFLLQDKPEWDEDAIKKAMNKGEEQYIHVDPTPVFILYFTTWLDADGKIQIRNDLYGLDKVQAAEMKM